MIADMRLQPTTLVGIVFSMVGGVVLGVSAFWALDEWLGVGSEHRLLLSVVDHVDRNYVTDVSREKLMHDAIAGMMRGLDGHSVFLREDRFDDLHEDTTGRFGGIGIEIALTDGYFTVVNPIADTPAARAGIAAGDRVVELDHASLKGRNLHDIVASMRGKPGTEVHLRVRRPGQEEPIDFELVRAVVATNSVRARPLEPGFGYVRISRFQDTTEDDLADALAGLEAKWEGLSGLVVDLRDNPGGVLGVAVDVADAFLDSGLIVYTESRVASNELRLEAEEGDLLDGAPIAVLINGQSASGAEIVAGALQDHGRALVVGMRSYGKGSVQSVLSLENRRAIKLTTAHYYTPSGRAIQSSGIEPDIEVKPEAGMGRTEYADLLIQTALQALQDGGEGPKAGA